MSWSSQSASLAQDRSRRQRLAPPPLPIWVLFGLIGVALSSVLSVGSAVPAGAGGAESSDPAVAAATGYVSMAPTVVFDTVVGLGTARGRLASGRPTRVDVTEADALGRPTGIPALATAALLQLTVTGGAGAGVLGTSRCGDSSGNDAVAVDANGIGEAPTIVALDGNGGFCVTASIPVELRVVVVGWFAAGTPYVQAPAGQVDKGTQSLRFRAQETRAIPLSRVPSDASAVVLTVALQQERAEGFVAVHDCLETPSTSQLISADAPVLNLVFVGVRERSVCVTSSADLTISLDVLGWFPPGGRFLAGPQARLVDTRTAGGVPPSDARIALDARSGQSAAVLTVTAVDPARAGSIDVSACSGAPIQLSIPRRTTSRTVVVPLSVSTASLCVTSSVGAHLVVDYQGVMLTSDAAAPPFAPPPSVELPVTNLSSSRSTRLEPFSLESRVLLPTASEPPLSPANWPGRYPQDAFGYVPLSFVPSAVARLRIGDANGRVVAVCSATVVAPTLVLTAAHCTVDAQKRPYAQFEVRPGQFATAAPLGSWLTSSAFVDDRYSPGDPAFDYALLRFDERRNGLTLGEITGWLPVAMGAAGRGLTTVSVGYPIEGLFGAACASASCYPWFCAAPPSLVVLGDVGTARSFGVGCVAGGGMSGAGVLARVAGEWAVVSVVSLGPRFSATGMPCGGANCAYSHNLVGPQPTPGFFDALWSQALS